MSNNVNRSKKQSENVHKVRAHKALFHKVNCSFSKGCCSNCHTQLIYRILFLERKNIHLSKQSFMVYFLEMMKRKVTKIHVVLAEKVC